MRLSCAAIALIALGAAGFFLVHSEKQLATLRADGRAFDLHAREVADALSDLRAAQQAYVAAGQGVDFWMPKVAQITDALRTSIGRLSATATSASARTAVDEAAARLAEFADVDKRARDYLAADQQLMAGDVIFTEGDQTAATAARSVETARLAEHQALDASEAGVHREEALALAGAGGVTALIVLLLGVVGGSGESTDAAGTTASSTPSLGHLSAPSLPTETQMTPSRAVSPVLRTAAQLCTDFGCMRDLNDLQQLLARASDVMDAAGLIVWMGSATGADLQPVLTHGYSDQARARLPVVPRTADNAAAAAYRSGDVQVVRSRPGGSKGAIVAPIRGAQGCIGALSAEIRGGGEASESVQALATIVAAQLAGVLVTPQAEISDTRTAASS